MDKTTSHTSRLIYGCMGLGGSWDNSEIDKTHVKQARKVIELALEHGITTFDHADIYTLGKAESVFGRVLQESPELRNKITIQSKCGIRFADDAGPKRYDLSANWVKQSVDNSLQRLCVEKLDMLLLHRPDPLMEVEELANTLTELHKQGKIVQIGVSNMHAAQINYLQSSLELPIVANQIEMSLASRDWLEDGITTNTAANPQFGFATGTLEYCQQNNIQLQAWGSLAKGLYTGSGDASVEDTTTLVAKLAAEYQVAPEAIVLAWLLRHPASIFPVIGTTNHQRIKASKQAETITLTREHWYALLDSARGHRVP